MRVILMKDLRDLGKRGQVVRVKPGFARNYLVPQGLALEATPGNQKIFEQQRRKIDLAHAQERDKAVAAAGEVTGIRVTIAKRVGETETLYGSVTATEIAEKLAEQGVIVDRRRIDLEGGIKSLGDHPVRIELHPEVVAELTVTVVAEE